MEIPIPETYEEWRKCIEKRCGINIDVNFIDERQKAMKNLKDPSTRRFIDLYGETHYQKILGFLDRGRDSV